MPLRIRKIDCCFRAETPLGLNLDVPTVTLRGAFGYALREFVTSSECYLPDLERSRCYRDLFEPEGEPGGRTRNAPRPFVMRGGFDDESGRNVLLEMLLFGRAVEYEPLVLEVLANMGRRGLGRWNTPASMEILSIGDGVPEFPAETFRIEVDFLAPVRLKAFKRRWLDDVPFPVLISRLTERYAELVRLYRGPGDRDWRAWGLALKTAARAVASTRLDGGRYTGRRISTRTGNECRLDGFVGRMLYEGNFAPFSEILAYLPFIHVGKSAAFGCGWCTVTCESLRPAGPCPPGRTVGCV